MVLELVADLMALDLAFAVGLSFYLGYRKVRGFAIFATKGEDQEPGDGRWTPGTPPGSPPFGRLGKHGAGLLKFSPIRTFGPFPSTPGVSS